MTVTANTYDTGATSDIEYAMYVFWYRRKVQGPISSYAKCMMFKIQSVLLWFIIRQMVKGSFVSLVTS